MHDAPRVRRPDIRLRRSVKSAVKKKYKLVLKYEIGALFNFI